MRILAAIHPPDTTRVILECLDLPSRAPPIALEPRDEQLLGVADGVAQAQLALLIRWALAGPLRPA